MLLLLLDFAVTDSARDRLVAVLAAATRFPNPVLQIYVEAAVRRAHDSGMQFSALADCLIQGLREKVAEVVRPDVIARTYGFTAAQDWRRIIGESNPGHVIGVRTCI